ncbi:diacylglycerol kinase [Micrococcaceae bacterium RIT802]|nr:diacylglycerol kinase [Micrococcaceae bacterium RIT 802]
MEDLTAQQPRYSRIFLVFNPDPEKKAPHLARLLRDEIAERLPGVPVELSPTDHAGHGRELARLAAAGAEGDGGPSVLIVSVSGDGGYNDVVNGVMDVPGSTAVCAVLPAGNANDHRRSVESLPVIDAIAAGGVRRMDLLRLCIGAPGDSTNIRYAHSYIGFGLTAEMGRGIERAGKGGVRELLGVVRTLPRLRPFEIERADGARARFDSLILANVARMAKYGTVSDAVVPSDGRFEVIALPHSSRWALALMTLRAVTIGLGPQDSVERYAFTTTSPLPVQLDGELLKIPAGASIVVESAHRAIRVIG